MNKNNLLKTVFYIYILFLTLLLLTKFSLSYIYNIRTTLKFYIKSQGIIYYRYNITPFRTILSQLNQLNIYNLAGNILIFIPFGFLLKYIYNIKLIFFIFITFLYIFFIEIMQHIFLIGFFDIDDFILNLFDSLIGYFLAKIFYLKQRLVKDKIIDINKSKINIL